MKTVLKRLVECLPGAWQQGLRRRHYRKVLDDYDPASWEYYPVAKQVVVAGDTVVDVGANVGYISAALASLTGEQGRVIAVEPIPLTFDVLSETARRPGCGCIEPVQAALSETEGQGTMAVPRYPGGGGRNYYESSLEAEVGAGDEAEEWTVPLKTLDQLCAEVDQGLSFIKIDVEGHERRVIAGGKVTLKKFRPWLLIEVAGDPAESGSEASGLFDDLTGLGYQPCVLGPDGEVVNWNSGVRRVDYLFRPLG